VRGSGIAGAIRLAGVIANSHQLVTLSGDGAVSAVPLSGPCRFSTAAPRLPHGQRRPVGFSSRAVIVAVVADPMVALGRWCVHTDNPSKARPPVRCSCLGRSSCLPAPSRCTGGVPGRLSVYAWKLPRKESFHFVRGGGTRTRMPPAWRAVSVSDWTCAATATRRSV
jgi:hypothetical protein